MAIKPGKFRIGVIRRLLAKLDRAHSLLLESTLVKLHPTDKWYLEQEACRLEKITEAFVAAQECSSVDELRRLVVES